MTNKLLWGLLVNLRDIQDPNKTFWHRLAYTHAPTYEDALDILAKKLKRQAESEIFRNQLIRAVICLKEGKKWIEVADITHLAKSELGNL